MFIQCLSAFIACLGFSFVFRVHHNYRFGVAGSLGGTLGWFIYCNLNHLNNTIIQTFIAMFCVALFSEFMARAFYAPATIFIIIGCFPLVPGKGIYESMLYCVQGNNEAFLSSLVTTLSISGAIAFAILLVSTIFKISKTIRIGG